MNSSLRTRALVEMGLAPLWRARSVVALEDLSSVAVPVTAPRLMLEHLGLAELQSAITGCTACERSEFRQQAIAGSGPANASLVVIDEVPGTGAARADRYLVVEADRLLEQILVSLGLTRGRVYLSHIGRCDGAPLTHPQSDTCSGYLMRELELIRPRAVLALGLNVKALLQRLGKWSEEDYFVIAHPERMLGNGALKRQAWTELARLKRLLGDAAKTPTR